MLGCPGTDAMLIICFVRPHLSQGAVGAPDLRVVGASSVRNQGTVTLL
jgi:hypothetical protein